MEKIKDGLLSIVYGLKKESKSPNSESMAREIASIATRYFHGDRNYVNTISNVLKGRFDLAEEIHEKTSAIKEQEINSGGVIGKSKWDKEWNARGQSSKTTNIGPQTKKEDVVSLAEDQNEQKALPPLPLIPPIEDQDPVPPVPQLEGVTEGARPIELRDLIKLDESGIVDLFNGFDNAKEFCRKLALDLDYRLGPAKFLPSLIELIEDRFDITQEEE